MKAIVYTKYGPPDVLQLREVAKPVPQDNQVLVKVHPASANALDFRRFEMQSLWGRFGDAVLLKAINKVLGADIAGAFAEYACAAEDNLALKPANLSFEAVAGPGSGIDRSTGPSR